VHFQRVSQEANIALVDPDKQTSQVLVLNYKISIKRMPNGVRKHLSGLTTIISKLQLSKVNNKLTCCYLPRNWPKEQTL